MMSNVENVESINSNAHDIIVLPHLRKVHLPTSFVFSTQFIDELVCEIGMPQPPSSCPTSLSARYALMIVKNS